MTYTIEDYIRNYVKLRNCIADVKARQKEELSAYTEKLDRLNDLIRVELNNTGADSLKTKEGTAFKKKWVSYKVSDMQALIGYVKETGRFDLFEQKVCKSIIEDIPEGVPGVDKEEGIDVQIRCA